MPLTPGTRIGAYEVIAPLGAGGMGEVFRARDARLGRDVAIKTLPPAFASDPERLARFEREARLLASLNHPNVAAIHGLEEAGGARFLVLECVEGETLAARLARGPLPVAEALEVARQVACGVEAAHESGAVHRDLKPGNVMLTPGGDVKVLDFGLAKSGAADPAGSDPNLSASPTMTHGATAAGVILGTAAYMSPEQARGKLVDKRSDIWSFGCVLYECLTGRRLFEGETVSDLIARILERTPDLSALPAATPPRVRALLERCLEKDPKRRLRDIGEARLELEAAIAGRPSAAEPAAGVAAPAAGARAAWRRLAFGAAGLLVGVALGAAVWGLRGAGGDGPRTTRLSLVPPADLLVRGYELTPDGRGVVVVASERPATPGDPAPTRIYLRALDGFEFTPIPGTEDAAGAALSPDGKWIAFNTAATRENSRRRLSKVALDGSSPPVVLADWQDGWSEYLWLHDGDLLLLANRTTELVRVPTSGGEPPAPVRLNTGDASIGQLTLRSVLPGDRGVLVSRESWGSNGYQLDTWLLDPKSGRMRELIKDSGFPSWSPTGHVVFSRGDALLAVPFDPKRGAVTGEVVPLLSGLRSRSSWSNASFSLAGGHLMYAPGGITGTRRRLMVAGPGGDTTEFAPERREFERNPRVSRNGRRAAVVMSNPKGTWEIWLAERGAPGLRPGVALPNADCSNACLSPDGERLAFTRNGRSAEDGLYVVRAGSGEAPTRVLPAGGMDVSVRPESWLPDGSGLIVLMGRAGRGSLVFVPLAGDSAGVARPMRSSPASVNGAQLSPDGKLVAFTADDSGTPQAYVARLLPNGTLDAPVPVPSLGVAVQEAPRWSGDGRRLVLLAGDQLAAAPVSAGVPVSVGRPERLFSADDLGMYDRQWTTTPDGGVLFIRRGEDEGDIALRDVVLNWDRELRAKAAKAGRGR